VTLLAVGIQTPEQGKAMGLSFPVLSDPGLEVARKYGLLHPGGMMGKDCHRPATILLEQGRRIRWIHVGDSIRIRPTPDQVFEELRK
jgi:peroxiredoxin